VGNSEGKILLGRRSHRWMENINMDLGEIRWEVWTALIWFRM
jgi:hypothetical protein